MFILLVVTCGNPPGQLMDDSDGDDVWTITLEAAPGSEITYKFANGQ